jgi:hypothetical protein
MINEVAGTSLMGKSAWYSLPLSVMIGIPLYSIAAGIILNVSVLIEKALPSVQPWLF